MVKRPVIYLSALVTVVMLASTLAGASGLGTLTVTRSAWPEPSTEVLAEWKRDLLETDEFWAFIRTQVFFDLVTQHGLTEEIQAQLLNAHSKKISVDDYAKVLSLYSVVDAQSFVFIPASLKARLPLSLLRTAYEYLFDCGHLPPHKKFKSRELAEKYFIEMNVSDEDLVEVMSKVYELKDGFYFFFTPDIWPRLNETVKSEVVRQQIQIAEMGQALNVTLNIGPDDDIEAIAKKYAGARDTAAIEHYLLRLMMRSQNGEVAIPLQQILQPFIRDTFGTYSMCFGPNCVNSGLSVNQGRAYQQRFEAGQNNILKSIFSRYRFVEPNEPLATGDLLVYFDFLYSIRHVSTYVAEDIVFTKNGLTKFSPYIFQSRRENENMYFDDGLYMLMVMRTPGAGEKTVDDSGQPEDSEPIYYINKIYEEVSDCANDLTGS